MTKHSKREKKVVIMRTFYPMKMDKKNMLTTEFRHKEN